jgi:Sulfotransferase domain
MNKFLWLASYPRSGNTFFRRVFEAIAAIPTYTRYADDAPKIHHKLPHYPAAHQFPWACIGQEPLFLVKTHEADDALINWPAILLVRDGRAAIWSFAHFQIQECGNTGNLEQITKEHILNHGWALFHAAWLAREAPTAIVKYDDLVAHPKQTVRKALSDLTIDIPLTDAPVPTFEQLHQENPIRYRKGIPNAWQNEMHPVLKQLFLNTQGYMLDQLSLPR